MYPHQTERLTQALDRAGLDALVATSPANVAYITGWHGHPGAASSEVAIFTRSGTALVTRADTAPDVLWQGVDADHVIVFGGLTHSECAEGGRESRRLSEIIAESSRDEGAALAAALERLGARQGAVGLDETGLPPGRFPALEAALGGARVTPGAAALAVARRVKGPYEIECLANALRIAEEALDKVIQAMERGTTEREAADLFSAEVIRAGAWPFPPLVGMGDRTSLPAPRPTDRALSPGALVRLDVGCMYKGHCASVARTAILGEPSARVESVYGAIQSAVEDAADAAREGAPVGRPLAAALVGAREAGLASCRWDRIGHGIGLERREPPELGAGDAPLEAGEVLCVEAAHHDVGDFGVSARDTVLVATGGGRALNRSHHGLVVLD